MKPRELAGAIRRAESVYVWVQFHPERGCYLLVPKSTAREIVSEAKENQVEVDASLDDGELHIGGEPTARGVEPISRQGGTDDDE